MREMLDYEKGFDNKSRYISNSFLLCIKSYLASLFKVSSLRYGYALGPVCSYMIKMTLLIRSNKNCYQSLHFYRYWDIMKLLVKNWKVFNNHLYEITKLQVLIRLTVMTWPGHFSRSASYRAFIQELLKVVSSIKPAYELIGAIIAAAIRLKMITPKNYNEYSQHIRIDQDLRGETREVIELWSLDKQKQK